VPTGQVVREILAILGTLRPRHVSAHDARKVKPDFGRTRPLADSTNGSHLALTLRHRTEQPRDRFDQHPAAARRQKLAAAGQERGEPVL